MGPKGTKVNEKSPTQTDVSDGAGEVALLLLLFFFLFFLTEMRRKQWCKYKSVCEEKGWGSREYKPEKYLSAL